MWLHSKPLIFYANYDWVQLHRVLYYISLERLAGEKHSSLLGPFISNEEHKVWRLHSQHFITYEWAQLFSVLFYTGWKDVRVANTLTYWDHS
jgi:hypothetical protein